MKNGLVSRGIDFGPVSVASGTLNNFGEGWPYHKHLRRLLPGSFNFNGATLVSKTATLPPRKGNMPLDDEHQPIEMFPKCIWANPLEGIALNAVGLSNPGLKELLAARRWQSRQDPFFISVMAVDGELQQKLDETKKAAELISHHMKHSRAKFGIQQNVSCPNTGHDPAIFSEEALEYGYVHRSVHGDVPIDLKINVMTPIGAIKRIQENNIYDSITCSNTIPWGKMPEWIDWKKLFRSDISPLRRRGLEQDGGLSGWPLLAIVEAWIKEARAAGIKMPITAGGGILRPDDVNRMKIAGANAIAIGSVAFLKPWNVQPIIQRAIQLFGGKS